MTRLVLTERGTSCLILIFYSILLLLLQEYPSGSMYMYMSPGQDSKPCRGYSFTRYFILIFFVTVKSVYVALLWMLASDE
jgi:hypothetical protein